MNINGCSDQIPLSPPLLKGEAELVQNNKTSNRTHSQWSNVAPFRLGRDPFLDKRGWGFEAFNPKFSILNFCFFKQIPL